MDEQGAVSREGIEYVALGRARFAGEFDAQRLAVIIRATLGAVVDWHYCAGVLDSLHKAGYLAVARNDSGRTFYTGAH